MKEKYLSNVIINNNQEKLSLKRKRLTESVYSVILVILFARTFKLC